MQHEFFCLKLSYQPVGSFGHLLVGDLLFEILVVSNCLIEFVALAAHALWNLRLFRVASLNRQQFERAPHLWGETPAQSKRCNDDLGQRSLTE